MSKKDRKDQGNCESSFCLNFICKHHFFPKKRSSSRSPSPDRSSPEVERSRNGRSSSPHDHQQKPEVTTQHETTKGETVRKWKIRKQVSTVETTVGDSEAPRKRRWGTSQLLPTKKPALVISTDSLKVGSPLNSFPSGTF